MSEQPHTMTQDPVTLGRIVHIVANQTCMVGIVVAVQNDQPVVEVHPPPHMDVSRSDFMSPLAHDRLANLYGSYHWPRACPFGR
jgi:hypothetical protein